MNRRNRYLTGVLLVLIGILVGGVLVMLQQGTFTNDQANVRFTEVKTSEKPLFSDADLEKLDDRFLFKNVAERVIPTVVYISTVVSLDGDEQLQEEGEDSFWDRFQSRRARTVGSGVIVSPEGYIVTNNHVIQGAVSEGISVILNDKRVYDARIVGTDPTTDLAILKVDARGLPSITFGNSDEVSVGEWVLAIGNPFRLRSTVTAGIVSALSRQVQIGGEGDSQLRIDSFIQTDAAINKGNSGGALVNTSGELIGINTAIATQSGSYQGYGFAVPSNLVRKVMRDLIEFGEVHRALLGVTITGVNHIRARQLGLDRVRGVEVMALADGGAARRHDIRRNDVILAVDGEPVNESNELQEEIAVHRPGDTVRLKIWRNGGLIEREVELGRLESTDIASVGAGQDRTDEEGGSFDGDAERGIALGTFPSVGLKVMALSKPENDETFDLIISEVLPDSEARRQGLKEGYLIRAVDGQSVETLQQLDRLFRRSREQNTLLMMRIETPDGATGYYTLQG